MSADDTPQPGAYTGPWYEERNERRRETYHTDPEYREKANKQAREGYRHSKGVQKPFDPRVNLPKIETFGTVRAYEGDTPEMAALSFSKSEIAALFDRPVKQVQQWATDGRIPAPVHRGKVMGKERNWIDIYTLDEARALVSALGPLFENMIYFRCDHVDAIRAVHDSIEEVRG